ncbi:hypothetical protein [Thermococcus sp. 2319x1]|nr:hypothetical protein [Thermococcus sp. 2319x1]
MHGHFTLWFPCQWRKYRFHEKAKLERLGEEYEEIKDEVTTRSPIFS